MERKEKVKEERVGGMGGKQGGGKGRKSRVSGWVDGGCSAL